MIWPKEWELKVDDELVLNWVEERDLQGDWLSWLQNPKVIEWLEGPRLKKYQQKDLEDYFNNFSRAYNESEEFKLIAIRYHGKHIGNITISEWSNLHKSATLGIVIGDPSCWGRGIAKRVLTKLCTYLMSQDGGELIRLEAGAFVDNRGSVKAFQQAGFVQEGIFKKARCFNGQYFDLIWMAIVR